MELMRSQKNQLLEIIKRKELDPFNFEWVKEVDRSKLISLLKYKDTDYLFGTKIYPDYFEWVASPGLDYLIEKHVVYSWNDVVVGFHYWLNYLNREIEQPDLWGELERIKEFGDIEYEVENTMQQFSYQETSQIEEGINNIRDYLIKEVKGNAEEVMKINEKLDYLIDASKRMGRIDWRNVFIGTVVNIITSVGLNPEQVQVVAQLFQSAVTGIMRLVSSSRI